MSKAIEIEGVYKLYQLGKVGTGTVASDLNRWWNRVRGKEDPYEKLAAVNERSVKGDSDFVWAVQDISFSVNRGEIVGIIGRNGAGKSTLLKILSRITVPTKGEIKIKGKLGSLLEVGTGFHGDLSGRENIYLNGAILGMRKQEIKAHFDEIVDFSGVERYIDTPVKRYSSGMYVRLAFAVAASLRTDILVVDEVLAVGDAEFQKRCLGKMKDASNSGKTILFVSHNMVAVQNLCNRCVFLSNGRLFMDGATNPVVNEYLRHNLPLIGQNEDRKEGIVPASWDRPWGHRNVNILKVQILDEQGQPTDKILFLDKLKVRVYFEVMEDVIDVKFQIRISTPESIQITRSDSRNDGIPPQSFAKGNYHLDYEADVQLMPGDYSFFVYISSLDNTVYYDAIPNFGRFTVDFVSGDPNRSEFAQKVNTFVNQPAQWIIHK